MAKQRLVARISKESKINLRQAYHSFPSLFGSLTSTLKTEPRVSFVGLGAFTTAKRKARIRRNPQTGNAMTIPAARAAKLRSAKMPRETLKKQAAAKIARGRIEGNPALFLLTR